MKSSNPLGKLNIRQLEEAKELSRRFQELDNDEEDASYVDHLLDNKNMRIIFVALILSSTKEHKSSKKEKEYDK